MEVWLEILKALITAGLALVGVIIANSKASDKTNALIQYRLEELEKKVDIHNSVIDRTYKLEERTELQEAELKRQNERLKILEANR